MNPAAIKAFAASRLSRTKTDRVDAELIARFCLAQQPPPWTPPAPEVRELQALVRRLESLIEMRVAEENRLSAGITVAAVSSSVEEMIAHLKEQIARTEKLSRDHIDKHPGFSPFFQQWAEGLRQRGKSKLSVIGAVMRKLIHIAYGVLKSGRPFDPDFAKSA